MPKPLSREDEVTLRMLRTPPTPHVPLKAKEMKKTSRKQRVDAEANKAKRNRATSG